MRLVLELIFKDNALLCAAAEDMDTGTVSSFGPWNIDDVPELISKATLIVGMDLFSKINKLGMDIACKIIDVSIMSKLAFGDSKSNDHSISRYSRQFNLPDIKYNKDEWSPDMQDACLSSITTLKKTYRYLKDNHLKDIPNAINLETNCAKLLDIHQYNFGMHFDISEAIVLRDYCEKRISEIIFEARTFGFGRPFNGKDDEMVNILIANGWSPTEYTNNGNPKLTSDILEGIDLYVARLFEELRVLKKIRGYLSTGKNAWLKMVDADGRIRHACSHIGSGTHRVSHSRPNLGQIPSSKGSKLKTELGTRCRKMFSAGGNYIQVGADLSGIEVRCLAHYLYPYDNGRFASIVLNGDVHWNTVLALGLCNDTYDESNPTHKTYRDIIAKTFMYAFIYGAGSEKLSSILCTDKQSASFMSSKFMTSIGLDGLKNDIENKVSMLGHFKGIDGRLIYCDKKYKALNYLLQSAGAIIAKTWMLVCHKNLKDAGFVLGKCYHQMAFVHDEIQFALCASRSVDLQRFKEIIEYSAVDAGNICGIRLPINAKSMHGNDWSECH